jgi:outer membrane protein OmpA-like peptidoglycan-associated protein
VKNFLVDRGIKAERIIVEYFGSSKPVADNKTRQEDKKIAELK